MSSAAPPPYESVMQDTGGHHFFSAATSSIQVDDTPPAPLQRQTPPPQPQPDAITVTEPNKIGEGVAAYIAYKVSRTSPPSEAVLRRFRDFSWLQHKLQQRHKGVIIPPLPEKSTVQKFQMAADFIESRRRALQVFLCKVYAHPVLRDSPEVNVFLMASDAEWQLEMARWQVETAAASKPAAGGAMQWFRSLQHSAQNMVAGRSDDAMEDAEYIKVRDYINSLEAHLNEAQRQVGRLGRKEAELAGALAEFANAGEQLGKFDDGVLRASFDVLSARAGQIAAASRQRADALAVNFEAPLHEFARSIKSVQVAMADRAAALSAFVQAKGDLDGKKVRLAKLRGTPGLKEERMTEAEREVVEAEEKVRCCKAEYDGIAARMTEELNRYQKERALELHTLLKDFALTQARCAAENARAWSSLLQEIQQQQQQQQPPNKHVPTFVAS